MASILIIDDEENLCRMFVHLFEKMGHVGTHALTLAAGMEAIGAGGIDVVFLDVHFPEGDGLSLLPRIKEMPFSPEVIIMTGAGDPDGAELAVRNGAFDYLTKIVSIPAIKLALLRALEHRESKRQTDISDVLDTSDIIGSCLKIRACLTQVSQAARSETDVLLKGETGTGKELFARAAHNNSPRANEHFVVVDCAALPESLVASVLFGHEKGAFTGAEKARTGLVKHAHGGTLFLDEVGELPLPLQGTFLRVLQERRFLPIGSTEEVASDFRLIAATNKDLSKMAEEGKFRADLLFRLNSLVIDLPPLRERAGDIAHIALHQIKRVSEQAHLEAKGMTPSFLAALSNYHWPGNVRELMHTVEVAVHTADQALLLLPQHLPLDMRARLARTSFGVPAAETNTMETAVESPLQPLAALPELRAFKKTSERQYLQELVRQCQGDIEKACQISGMSRPRLYVLLREHEISIRG
jgi:two-component system, NtrC family, response regulator